MGEVFPILSSWPHYPYLYPTNLSTLIGLRILTPYSLFDLTVHNTFPLYSTYSQDHSPCSSISNLWWFILRFITHDLSNGPKLLRSHQQRISLLLNYCLPWTLTQNSLPNKKSRLEQVILRNSGTFSINGRIGRYDGILHPIHLKEDVHLVLLAPYHAPLEKREAIDKQLDKWFSQDVIQESNSPWGAPIIVVYRNGKPRVCIDYRRVNNLSESDENPLPKQTDILRSLSGFQWLSTFNALSGFQQVEVVPEHRHIMAFRTHRGLLEFSWLPFGLQNSPALFQRIMNKALAKFLWLFILVYIDDIVVCYRMGFMTWFQVLINI